MKIVAGYEGESRIKIVWLLHETTMMIMSNIVTIDNFKDYQPKIVYLVDLVSG